MKNITIKSCIVSLVFLFTLMLVGCGADSIDLGDTHNPTPSPTTPAPPTEDFSLSGKVTDSNGAAIPNPIISFDDSTASNNFAVGDVNGNYTLKFPKAGSYSVTFYEFTCFPSTETIQINKGSKTTNKQLSKRALVAGTVTGRLTNADYSPIAGVNVQAQSNGTQIGSNGITDANGLYDISGLPNGSYTIVFTYQGGGGLSTESGTFTIDLLINNGVTSFDLVKGSMNPNVL